MFAMISLLFLLPLLPLNPVACAPSAPPHVLALGTAYLDMDAPMAGVDSVALIAHFVAFHSQKIL